MSISSHTSPEVREKVREYQRHYRTKRQREEVLKRVIVQELYERACITFPVPQPPKPLQSFIDQPESQIYMKISPDSLWGWMVFL